MRVLGTLIAGGGAMATLLFGVMMLTADSAPWSAIVVGAVTVGFGVVAAVVLVMAWRRPGSRLLPSAFGAVAGLFSVWVGASLDGGSIVGLEEVGLAVVAAVALTLPLGVRLITRRR